MNTQICMRCNGHGFIAVSDDPLVSSRLCPACGGRGTQATAPPMAAPSSGVGIGRAFGCLTLVVVIGLGLLIYVLQETRVIDKAFGGDAAGGGDWGGRTECAGEQRWVLISDSFVDGRGAVTVMVLKPRVDLVDELNAAKPRARRAGVDRIRLSEDLAASVVAARGLYIGEGSEFDFDVELDGKARGNADLLPDRVEGERSEELEVGFEGGECEDFDALRLTLDL